jgi:hypothetical protein
MQIRSESILFETSVPVSRFVGEFPGGQQLREVLEPCQFDSAGGGRLSQVKWRQKVLLGRLTQCPEWHKQWQNRNDSICKILCQKYMQNQESRL